MVRRDAAHAAFLNTLAKMEARLRRPVIAEKKRFVRACAERYAADKTPNFFDLVHTHQEALFEILKAHYARVIPAFGTLALGQIRTKHLKAAAEHDLFHALTQDWVAREGLKRSKLIADTTEADVLAAVSDGLDAGDGVDAISRSIRGVTGLSAFRADLIARTETHAAANFAGIESVRDAADTLGVVMQKEWLPTLDARTRPDHAAMAGYGPIPLDERFIVGGEAMDRPGDPAATADQTCNCRCALGFSEVTDQQ